VYTIVVLAIHDLAAVASVLRYWPSAFKMGTF
jgi:hypothetical protein